MMSQQTMQVAGLACVAAIGLVFSGVLLERRVIDREGKDRATRDETARPPSESVGDWETLKSGPNRLGGRNTGVTLVIFRDFECPACRMFTLGALAGVRGPEGGDVTVVFRHFTMPYHDHAIPTAIGAECAGRQSRFWEFHDAAYEHQADLGVIPIDSLAAVSGVPDLGAFRACLVDPIANEVVERDQRLAHAIGANATPSLVLNGEFLRFVPDSAELSHMIQEVRQKRTSK